MGKPPKQQQTRRRAQAAAGGGWLGRRWWIALTAVAICGVGFTVWAVGRDAPIAYRSQVVGRYPHDPGAYCQGLVFADGVLYEGTGRYGESTLRKVDVASGRLLRQVPLDRSLFGEGITVLEDKIFQLTWREHVAIVYDKQSLRELRRFRYTGEGWGLTHDGKHLIMSDGTPTLRFIDPDTFRVVKRLTVYNGRHRVRQINELEYINGEIFANIWYQDYVLRISPHSGEVTGWIDLSNLWPSSQRPDRDAVLNGIAYDAENDRLFVTGKHWPNLFEIRLSRDNRASR